MTANPNDVVPSGPGPLRRNRQDQILGGVCSGVARRLGINPALVRIAAMAVAFGSGGAAFLGYLIAWVLIPLDDDPPRPPVERRSARDAWGAAGVELRSLASSLQQPAPDAVPATGTEHRGPSATAPIDAAMTSLGDRLRSPEVRDGARRTAAEVSAAVGASVDQLTHRARRADSLSVPAAAGDPSPTTRGETP